MYLMILTFIALNRSPVKQSEVNEGIRPAPGKCATSECDAVIPLSPATEEIELDDGGDLLGDELKVKV